MNKTLVVLDEVGRMELLSQQFRTVVKKLLDLSQTHPHFFFLFVIPLESEDTLVKELHAAPQNNAGAKKYELTKMNRYVIALLSNHAMK